VITVDVTCTIGP